MYHVKVTGNYIARSSTMDKEKVVRPYEIEGQIPTLHAALSIVKNKLLAPALSAKYPDYVSYLTYHIVEITPLDTNSATQMEKVEVAYMDKDQLAAYIKEHALPVLPRYYPDLFKLREAVQLAKDDPQGYLKQFELRKADLEMDLQMAAANPHLFDQTKSPTQDLLASVSSPQPEVPPQRAGGKASSAPDLAIKTEDRLRGLKQDMIREKELQDTPEDPDMSDL